MADGRVASARNRTLPFYLGAVSLVLAAAIAVASFSVELGISRPGSNARRVAVAVAEIDSTLDAGSDFVEFSEALLAGLGARRELAVYNAADNRVGHAAERALDCYKALREAWQLELEGLWDPAIHGDPAYWRSFHDAVRLSGSGEVTPDKLRKALRQEARAYAAEAMSVVDR